MEGVDTSGEVDDANDGDCQIQDPHGHRLEDEEAGGGAGLGEVARGGL